MKVWIQKVGGEFHNSNPFVAWRGFEHFGWETLFFAKSELPALVENGQLTRENPVVGGIPAILEALQRLGCARPELEALPATLNPFAGRRVWIQTLGAVRQHIAGEGEALFVKPLPRSQVVRWARRARFS